MDSNGAEKTVSIEDTEWLRQKRSYVAKDLFGEIDSAKYINEDEWCYDKPEEFYDFSTSVIWDKRGDTIIGLTNEDYHLILYDIDWSSVPFKVLPGTFYEEEEREYGVVKWTLCINW